MNLKKQVSAPMTRFMGTDVFSMNQETAIYWLGSGGIFINSHGTTIMVDPVIENLDDDPEKSEAGFRYLVPPPLTTRDVSALEAVLYTHADYDHMAPKSACGLIRTGAEYYGTAFTKSSLEKLGVPGEIIQARAIGETFRIGEVRITLTPASHSWQKNRPEYDWCYGPEDCCGFYIETEDGNLWIPGDSILMEEHFRMHDVDAMFFDVSQDPFHFGPDASVELANTYEDADLLLYHYGTYDAPEKLPFNADPSVVEGRLRHPERLHILAPGERFILHQHKTILA